MFFSYNLLIPLFIVLPNLLFVVLPPLNMPLLEKEKVIWLILERIGQAGVFLVPLFHMVHLDTVTKQAAFALIIMAVTVYYFCWWRFFRNKRQYIWLFQPLGIIPIPMAVMPLLYFLASAIIMESLSMFLAAVCLGLGHLPISYKSYMQMKHPDNI
ncbi:hypothetical protein [Sporomusa sp.]|uniref:hypothetical protein n=1 Tax=Sporomusa sp. TaxID=2078658 RepID=UPI002C7491A0|nr:hypothetical protein [Sporomusa sp.]HWR07599.1 hypothetical protein [Sporomusa sp.]